MFLESVLSSFLGDILLSPTLQRTERQRPLTPHGFEVKSNESDGATSVWDEAAPPAALAQQDLSFFFFILRHPGEVVHTTGALLPHHLVVVY